MRRCQAKCEKEEIAETSGRAHAQYSPPSLAPHPEVVRTPLVCPREKVQLPSSTPAPRTYESEVQRSEKNSVLLPCVTRIRYQVCFFLFYRIGR